MKRILLSALSLVFIYPLYCQDILNDTIEVSEVIITASKIPRSLGNVTQKIDIISSLEIENLASGNRNIAEAIMYKPGASVTALSRNDANWGTYGGIGPKYSTYMLSGLPVDAFIDPMNLDLSAVDRIEIQRGPASVLYPNYLSQDFAGNQSPLAGTINMILKEKIEKTLTRASVAYGSYNTLNGQFYHQGKAGNLNYYTGASYESSDYTDYGSDNSWLNMQKNPLYRKTKIYGGMTWFPQGNNSQKFTLFINKTLHTGDAGRVYRGFDHNYGTLNAAYSLAVSNRLNLKAGMGFRQYDRSWQESNFGVIDTLKSENGVKQNIIPADITITFRHGRKNLFTAGVDYQGAGYLTWSDPLKGYKAFGNKSTAFQSGLYAQEEVYVNGLVIRGGIRYNYVRNNIELVDGGSPGEKMKKWDSFLWSAGTKYRFNPAISVFANAGNSFLTPGLKSMGGTISLSDMGVAGKNGQLPNPELRPESGTGIDAGTEFSLPFNIQLAIRAFHLSVDDAIIDNIVSQNPSQTQSVNAGKSTSTGFEAEVKQNVSDNMQWFLNYTFMKTEVDNAAAVPFAPKQVANAGINIKFPFELVISSFINYNDGYWDSSNISGRTFFKPGFMININIIQKIAGSANFDVEWFGQFHNVTDNRYDMPWQFRETGFSMMTGIRTRF